MLLELISIYSFKERTALDAVSWLSSRTMKSELLSPAGWIARGAVWVLSLRPVSGG